MDITAAATTSTASAGFIAIIAPIILYAGIIVLVLFLYRRKRTKPNGIAQPIGKRSRIVAALLAIFLGATGAHRYYLGYNEKAIIQTSGFVGMIIGQLLYAAAMANYETEPLILAYVFLCYGAAIVVWAFTDFIRILTGGLLPVDGMEYSEDRPAQVHAAKSAPSASDSADALEKLAKLHEQGVLSDNEFAATKKSILDTM